MAEKVHSFGNLGHRTLRKMADDVLSGKGLGADALKAVSALDVIAKAKQEPVPGADRDTQRKGRVLVFKPTGEKVTVVREKVGNAYNGSPIHEVISREGKRFLASEVQLNDPANAGSRTGKRQADSGE